MRLIRKKVDDAKTYLVFVVDYNIYSLRPMAIIGSKRTKRTNPPFHELGDFISFENFKIKEAQRAHDKIPRPFYSSISTGHNARNGLSTPNVFDTAYHCELNIEMPEGEDSSFIIPLPTNINP